MRRFLPTRFIQGETMTLPVYDRYKPESLMAALRDAASQGNDFTYEDAVSLYDVLYRAVLVDRILGWGGSGLGRLADERHASPSIPPEVVRAMGGNDRSALAQLRKIDARAHGVLRLPYNSKLTAGDWVLQETDGSDSQSFMGNLFVALVNKMKGRRQTTHGTYAQVERAAGYEWQTYVLIYMSRYVDRDSLILQGPFRTEKVIALRQGRLEYTFDALYPPRSSTMAAYAFSMVPNGLNEIDYPEHAGGYYHSN